MSTQQVCSAKKCGQSAALTAEYIEDGTLPEEKRPLCPTCWEKEDGNGVKFYQVDVKKVDWLK